MLIRTFPMVLLVVLLLINITEAYRQPHLRFTQRGRARGHRHRPSHRHGRQARNPYPYPYPYPYQPAPGQGPPPPPAPPMNPFPAAIRPELVMAHKIAQAIERHPSVQAAQEKARKKAEANRIAKAVEQARLQARKKIANNVYRRFKGLKQKYARERKQRFRLAARERRKYYRHRLI